MEKRGRYRMGDSHSPSIKITSNLQCNEQKYYYLQMYTQTNAVLVEGIPGWPSGG